MLNMIMKRYWIENISFNLDNEKYIKQHKEPVLISPEFKREIIEIDDNNAIVKIALRVLQSETIPFFVETTICGEFACEKWKESEDGRELMSFTSVHILFPYLRQTISTITGMANIPPYVLPIINVRALFKEERK